MRQVYVTGMGKQHGKTRTLQAKGELAKLVRASLGALTAQRRVSNPK